MGAVYWIDPSPRSSSRGHRTRSFWRGRNSTPERRRLARHQTLSSGQIRRARGRLPSFRGGELLAGQDPGRSSARERFKGTRLSLSSALSVSRNSARTIRRSPVWAVGFESVRRPHVIPVRPRWHGTEDATHESTIVLVLDPVADRKLRLRAFALPPLHSLSRSTSGHARAPDPPERPHSKRSVSASETTSTGTPNPSPSVSGSTIFQLTIPRISPSDVNRGPPLFPGFRLASVWM